MSYLVNLNKHLIENTVVVRENDGEGNDLKLATKQLFVEPDLHFVSPMLEEDCSTALVEDR